MLFVYNSFGMNAVYFGDFNCKI